MGLDFPPSCKTMSKVKQPSLTDACEAFTAPCNGSTLFLQMTPTSLGKWV